jgi:outer membrane protein TolC
VARLTVEQSELQYKNTKHAILPSLQAGLDYSRRNQAIASTDGQGGVSNETAAMDRFGLSATFTMPLGYRSAVGNKRRAEAAFYSERVTFESLERDIASQVRTQVRVLNAARAKVELEEINMRLASETLKAMEARLAVGRAIVKDVLIDRNSLETAKINVVRARWDYFVARVELQRLQGTLDTAL